MAFNDVESVSPVQYDGDLRAEAVTQRRDKEVSSYISLLAYSR